VKPFYVLSAETFSSFSHGDLDSNPTQPNIVTYEVSPVYQKLLQSVKTLSSDKPETIKMTD